MDCQKNLKTIIDMLKVGDKVKVRSRLWYMRNKREDDCVWLTKPSPSTLFNSQMSFYCGYEATITEVLPDDKLSIDVDKGVWVWTSEMFEKSETEPSPNENNVEHPKHYTSHPSGIECIDITEHHDFCIGNAIKYLWRAGLKADEDKADVQKEIEDLQKAVWYINRKIEFIQKIS